MTTVLRKYSTFSLISLLLTVLILGWFFPSAGLFLGILFLLSSFFIAAAAVFVKHRERYEEGKITHRVFLRTVSLEVTGTWLAMALAGLVGRAIVTTATQQISEVITQLIIGIVIGLLAGAVVGVLVSQTWGRFVKVSSE